MAACFALVGVNIFTSLALGVCMSTFFSGKGMYVCMYVRTYVCMSTCFVSMGRGRKLPYICLPI